ncbi:MAG TPA: cupredoxin domain-containing protein [Candidatus Limnocylindrales bacterium]|jgi:plastocyanin|nr:cupredoxin domain-containing protein [Candidatus Limnocylindrales bacterium]
MRGVVLLIAVAAIVAGCGSASTPAASSSAPTATAASPTLVPGAVTAPPAIEGAVELTAINIDFEPKELTAPAGAVVIHFLNKDSGIPHNVQVNDPSGGTLYQGEIVEGPGDMQLPIGELAAGTYPFTCTIHPNMQGTLTVVP